MNRRFRVRLKRDWENEKMTMNRNILWERGIAEFGSIVNRQNFASQSILLIGDELLNSDEIHEGIETKLYQSDYHELSFIYMRQLSYSHNSPRSAECSTDQIITIRACDLDFHQIARPKILGLDAD